MYLTLDTLDRLLDALSMRLQEIATSEREAPADRAAAASRRIAFQALQEIIREPQALARLLPGWAPVDLRRELDGLRPDPFALPWSDDSSVRGAAIDDVEELLERVGLLAPRTKGERND